MFPDDFAVAVIVALPIAFPVIVAVFSSFFTTPTFSLDEVHSISSFPPPCWVTVNSLVAPCSIVVVPVICNPLAKVVFSKLIVPLASILYLFPSTVTVHPFVASPVIVYFPAPILLFNEAFKFSSVKLPSPCVKASVTDNFTNSSVCAVPVFSFA